MTIIHQPTFLDIEILLELEPIQRYGELFSPLPIEKVVALFDKDHRVGRPITINYEATFKAFVVRYIEGIPTIKALIKRLKEDLVFKLSLGFLYSERIPSEATFSRFAHKLTTHPHIMDNLNHLLLTQIDEVNGLFSEQVALDATHVRAHDKAHQTVNDKMLSVEEQLKVSDTDLSHLVPTEPTWGIKKNSEGKNQYWFGYKAHLAVSTSSQYIVSSLLSSAHVSDLSVAVPLLRKLTKIGSRPNFIMMDKGYDVTGIYKECHRLSIEPIIDYNRRRETLGGEMDKYFHPTCLLEHPYTYDSGDTRYNALKFTCPKDKCKQCPLKNEGMCQKVIKIKQKTDIRKYSIPARGSNKWKNLYKLRSSVERVNGYLKLYYQLMSVRYNGGKAAKTHLSIIQLAYNSVRFAVERVSLKLKLVA